MSGTGIYFIVSSSKKLQYMCSSHFEVRVSPSFHPSLGLLVAHGSICSFQLLPGSQTLGHQLEAGLLFEPLWKIWVRQLGWLFPIYGKTKNIPNHQPDGIWKGHENPNVLWIPRGWIMWIIANFTTIAREMSHLDVQAIAILRMQKGYVILCFYIISCTFDWSYLMDLCRYAMMFYKPEGCHHFQQSSVARKAVMFSQDGYFAW